MAHCYGCGRLNKFGHHIKSYWDKDETVARFVTASLQVNYLKPTPLGLELELREKIIELKGKKVILEMTVSANGIVTAKGKVIAVQMPENFTK